MRDVGVMCLDCGTKCVWRNERTEIHIMSQRLMQMKHTYGCKCCSSRRNILWKSVGWLKYTYFQEAEVKPW